MARDLVLSSVRADEMMDALRQEVHGHLWIACSTTPGKYILPSLMENFLKETRKS